jgi:hypothetical protein
MTYIVTNDSWNINMTSLDFRKETDHVLWVAYHILLWLLKTMLKKLCTLKMEASSYFETLMSARKTTQFTVYVPCLSLSPAIYRGVAIFVPGPIHMGFLVDKVELGQVVFQFLCFSCVSIISKVFNNSAIHSFVRSFIHR